MEKTPSNNTQDVEVRKGPWTMEEDLILINYIVNHGEGVWNSLARSAGLKRTGKSCRLRWLNYLRPDVRRGNITHEEQQLIIELHARWGNRWSKIARQLPGRTDNEIKNFWRTRIQRQIKEETKQNNLIAPAQEDHDASTSYATCTSAMDESVLDCSDNHPMLSTGNIIAESFADPMQTDSVDDGFWSMEDIWTTQFFNGD